MSLQAKWVHTLCTERRVERPEAGGRRVALERRVRGRRQKVKGKPVIYAGERTTARCPKCKKQNFTTEEIFEEIVYMTIKNGVFPDEADDHQPGEILGVSCTCNECGHHWTPRGARTLGDIVDESSDD